MSGQVFSLQLMNDLVIDLHCHSTCSDGQYTPIQLIKLAIEKNIQYFSITDHDTFQSFLYLISHVDELSKILEDVQDFTYIPGCELTVNTKNDNRKHHMCVYFPQLSVVAKEGQITIPDQQNEFVQKIYDIEKELEKVRTLRIETVEKVMNNLATMFDLKLDFQEFCQMNNINMETKTCENVVGRPMIGQYLVHCGHCKTLKEAFEVYLNDKSPALIKLPPVLLEEKIPQFRELGAITILAHPFHWNRDYTVMLRDQIKSAVSVGLHGVEKYHWQQGVLDDEKLSYFDPKLVYSIGSDFHGEKVVPEVELGNLPMNKIMTCEEKQKLLELFGLQN